MCLGACHLAIIPPGGSVHRGGLRFKFLPCPKIRGGGTVTVELNWSDTYTVRVYNNRMRLVKEIEGVYADMLAGPTGVIEQVTGWMATLRELQAAINSYAEQNPDQLDLDILVADMDLMYYDIHPQIKHKHVEDGRDINDLINPPQPSDETECLVIE